MILLCKVIGSMVSLMGNKCGNAVHTKEFSRTKVARNLWMDTWMVDEGDKTVGRVDWSVTSCGFDEQYTIE